MSLDITAIEDAIYDWAASSSGRDVVWGKFDGLQPGSPFVSLDLTLIGQNHEDYVGNEVDENDQIDIVGHRTVLVNVLTLGSSDNTTISAMQIAHNIKASLSKPSTQQYFQGFGISIINDTEPRDVSFLYTGTNWEKRSTFDITFGVAFTDKDDVGYFDTVEITGEAITENDETKNIDITVP